MLPVPPRGHLDCPVVASIEERGDGWRVYWRIGGRGAQKQAATFHDPDDAARAKKLVEAHDGRITREAVYAAILDLEEDPGPASDKPTLREWVAEWLASRTRPSPNTLAYYRTQMEKRILPALGDKHLDLITGRDIGSFINQLRAEGLRETTITRYYAVLHAALRSATVSRDASGRRLLDANPCHETDFVRDQVAHDDDGSDDQPPVYLTPAQFRRLRSEFTQAYWPLLDALVGTGMRWSEATAAAVEAVTLTPAAGGPPSVAVSRAWKKDGKGGRYLGTTKGKKRRDVPLPGWLLPSAAALVAGRGGKEFLLLTPGRVGRGGKRAAGGPFEYSNFYHQVWRPAMLRAMRCPEHPPPDRGAQAPAGVVGVVCSDFGGTRDDGQPCGFKLAKGMTRCVWHMGPVVGAVSDCACPDVLHRPTTPHDLRHTYASWFLASGGQIRELQELLGHESVTTTEIYSGLQPGNEQVWADNLDRFWRDSLPSVPSVDGGTGVVVSPRPVGGDHLRRQRAR